MLDTLLTAARPFLGVAFTLWGSPVTWLEIVAFALSLAMVACNLRVNVLGWPLAIASSLLYAVLFADSRLYGEAALQGVFVAVAAWGWWCWRRRVSSPAALAAPGGGRAPGSAVQPPAADTAAVRWMPPRERRLALVATLAAWPALALLLARATDSDVPWLDAAPTVASVTGQVLLARKRVENWAVWLAVNVFSVGLFTYKGLALTALLYALFAVLSVVGWRAWKRLADGAPR